MRARSTVPTDGVDSHDGDAGATRQPQTLVLVVHDAERHGAQLNALNMARTLHERFGVSLEIVLLGNGPLWADLERFGRVHDFAGGIGQADERAAYLRRLRSDRCRSAICNTTVAGVLVGPLRAAGFRTVSLVHEMPGAIHDYGLESAARDIVISADAVVFASDIVRRGFEQLAGPLGPRAHIRPQGLYTPALPPHDLPGVRTALRTGLGLDGSDAIVLAVGWPDRRKGVDLFMDVAAAVALRRQDVAFVWIGARDEAHAGNLRERARTPGVAERVRFVPVVTDVGPWYAAADVMLVPSREDSFPSVGLEAMSHGLPVVAFDGATGMGELLHRGPGVLVPAGETGAMAAAVMELLDDPAARARMGALGRRIVAAEHDWDDYVGFVLALALPGNRSITSGR